MFCNADMDPTYTGSKIPKIKKPGRFKTVFSDIYLNEEPNG
jgi:hypothetical protein